MTSLRRIVVLPAALLLLLAPPPAHAVNKDMIQLQTQVQQLIDALARLQQSNDERMGVLKDLVQQNADSVNKMSANMDTLQHQLAAGPAANGVKLDSLSGQVQSLNDTLDEIKARMARLEKVLADVQSQQQSLGANLQSPPATTTAPPPTSPNTYPDPAYAAPTGTPLSSLSAPIAPGRKPSAAIPAATTTTRVPVDDLYKAALSDFMAARYAVATAEFGDVIKAYPDDKLSGNSFFYLGEIDYRAAKYATAVRDYDKVLEQFPDSNKIPAAHLHKGQALIEQHQTEAGVREFRTLIQRFPAAPEAIQARSKLNAMGVPIRPRT